MIVKYQLNQTRYVNNFTYARRKETVQIYCYNGATIRKDNL